MDRELFQFDYVNFLYNYDKLFAGAKQMEPKSVCVRLQKFNRALNPSIVGSAICSITHRVALIPDMLKSIFMSISFGKVS